MASLATYGVSPSVILKLIQADIVEDSEILKMKPSELSAATSLSFKESSEVIRLVISRSSNCEASFQATNLKQLLEKDERGVNHVVTFCESLDELLGGGIPLGTITEISGTPGIGKTQLCIQTCISAQIPEECGGVDGEVIFIDTEGSFMISRLIEMAGCAESHVQKLQKGRIKTFNTEKILKGLFYYRCNNYLELIAVVKNLHIFLKDHPKICLIIIDSIAFHFRHDFSNMMARTGLLCSITQDLIQQATKHNIAVMVTNQMTTKFETSGEGQLVAALGETWGHCPTLRLCLFWSGLVRSAKIVKAPHTSNSTINFQITSGGIRDRPFITQSHASVSDDENLKKRKYED